jgi:uncharacterized membrane protein
MIFIYRFIFLKWAAEIKRRKIMKECINGRPFMRMGMFLFIILLTAGSGLNLWAKQSRKAIETGNSTVNFKVIKAVKGLIKLPVSDFNDKQARFYIYRLPDSTVRFFVIKSQDGSIKAAFDACEVCYRGNKGYRQDADSMACNTCDNHFPIDSLDENRKGCSPVTLPHAVTGGQVVINTDDLKIGIRYFDF